MAKNHAASTKLLGLAEGTCACAFIIAASLFLAPTAHAAADPTANEENAKDGSTVTQPKNGLVKKHGKLRYYRKGKLVTNKKLKVKGSVYYFGKKGYAVRGASVKIKKRYWIFGNNGKLLKPKKAKFAKLRHGTFYVSRKGHPAKTGWFTRNDKLYYVGKSGKVPKAKQGIHFTGKGYARSTTASKLKMWTMRRVKQLTNSKMTRYQKLQRCWYWVLGSGFNNSLEPTDIGKPGWAQRAALKEMRSGVGECISYACTFSAFAYELGYTPTIKAARYIHGYVLVAGKRWDNMASQPHVSGAGTWKFTSWANTTPKASGVYAQAAAKKKATSKKKAKSGLVRTKKGNIYYYRSGKKLKNAWKTVKGKRFWFGASGKAARKPTKAKRPGDGKRFYYVFNSNGVLQRGTKTRTVKVGGVKYRVYRTGRAKPGWERSASGVKKRHFLKTGRMATGTRLVNGKLQVFAASGAYAEAKSRRLQAACTPAADASTLLALLGTPKKTKDAKNTCFEDPRLPEAVVDSISKCHDRTRTYGHVVLSTLVTPEGAEYVESIISR